MCPPHRPQTPCDRQEQQAACWLLPNINFDRRPSGALPTTTCKFEVKMNFKLNLLNNLKLKVGIWRAGISIAT
jgi:hypothetical protein